jgi:hypothetical protein
MKYMQNQQKGRVVITNFQTGTFEYIPNPDIIGSDSFIFSVKDSEFQSQPEIVRIEINLMNLIITGIQAGIQKDILLIRIVQDWRTYW